MNDTRLRGYIADLSLSSVPTSSPSSLSPFSGAPPIKRTNSAIKKDLLDQKNELGPKLVVVMVGLPARGKSYICKKLNKYLSWLGFKTNVFNVGNKRRTQSTGHPLEIDISPHRRSTSTQHDASFFDASNVDSKKQREILALETLEELIAWLHRGGKIGILDATNSTVERRRNLLKRISKEEQVKFLFVESNCTEGPVLEQNIEMKLSGPDYENVSREEAIQDFKKRIVNYEKVYESLSDEEEKDEISYVKIINIGKKSIAYNIQGYLQSHCVFYLMQLNIKKRTIWLTRHGESEFNLLHKIGGDPHITPRGAEYGEAIANMLYDHYSAEKDDIIKTGRTEIKDDNFGTVGKNFMIDLWTSTLQRTIETVENFNDRLFDTKNIRFLNEIYSGNMEGMTYEEIQKNFPEEWTARQANKLSYRYPGAGGESYLDVIERLRPLIIELERMEKDVIICTHNVVMRTLLTYFLGLPLSDMPTLNIPLHCLYRLEPKPYGADLVVYQWDSDGKKFTVIEKPDIRMM